MKFTDGVTGDAPQPGETPRNQSEPWAYGDPNTAWWRVEQARDEAEAMAEAAAARPRHPRRRPADSTPASDRVPNPGRHSAEPAFAAEALDAHAAGAHDAAKELAPPASMVEAEQEARIESVETTAAAKVVNAATVALPMVERDHDQRTTERFNPTPKTPEGYAVSSADESPKKEFPDLSEDATAVKSEAGNRADGVPDVMVLPEPSRNNRPTVPVAELRAGRPGDRRERVPEQPHTPRMSDAAERRLANSTFWVTDDQPTAEVERVVEGTSVVKSKPVGEGRPARQGGTGWPAPEMRQRLADAPESRRGKPPVRTPGSKRRPLPGMVGLVALALVAAFFSWVSAEPFWLAIGHGDKGVATVGQCTGAGVTQRCQGAFTAADGSFIVQDVALLGVGPEARNAGAVAPARMVSPSSDQVYVGDTGWLVHLRWVLGFILVLMCGYGIAGLTGARLLDTPQARRGAVLMSLAGPVLLLFGFLAAAY